MQLSILQFKLISIAGGTTQQTPDNETQLEDGTDLEANLDAETILGIAWPTPLTAFSTGGQPPFIPDDNTPTGEFDIFSQKFSDHTNI